jgi:hypothetical protein
MISLKAAARTVDVPERNLRDRVAEGSITVERRSSGRVRALVDLAQLQQQLAELRCQAPGCELPVHRAGRFCSHACSVRKYAAETRNCEHCGQPFAVPGHRAKDPGAALFCSPRCVALWRWENEPDTFPQSERAGEVVTCACGRTSRYMAPSQLHVTHCEQCRPRQPPTPAVHQAGREWRADAQDVIEAEASARGALLTRDVTSALGVTVPTATRFYADREGRRPQAPELTSELLTVAGVTVRIYPKAADEIPLLEADRRATVSSTWLDPHWEALWVGARHGERARSRAFGRLGGHPRGSTLSSELVARILRLAAADWSERRIADEIPASRSQIRLVLRKPQRPA